MFRKVLGRSVHQLPLLRAAITGVGPSVKNTAPVLSSSPRPQIRHGVPVRAENILASDVPPRYATFFKSKLNEDMKQTKKGRPKKAQGVILSQKNASRLVFVAHLM